MKLDFSKLSPSELIELNSIVLELKNSDPDTIKNYAVAEYINSAIKPSHADVFHLQCYLTGFVYFLNSKGYIIQKKEEVDEQ